MKRMICALLACAYIMTGCAQTNSGSSPDTASGAESGNSQESPADEAGGSSSGISDTPQEAGIFMETEESSYPLETSQLEVVITNQSEAIGQTGMAYEIQHYNGTEWETLPLAFSFTMQMIMIPPQESVRFVINLYHDQYEYTPGEYRVSKNVFLGEESLILTAEFILEESAL